MEFFISGQVDDAANVRAMMDKVEAAGHGITHDWTDSDVLLGGGKEKLNNLEEAAKRARADILGVVMCDVYVLSSDNENVGKGMYVELGTALGLQEIIGKPNSYRGALVRLCQNN